MKRIFKIAWYIFLLAGNIWLIYSEGSWISGMIVGALLVFSIYDIDAYYNRNNEFGHDDAA